MRRKPIQSSRVVLAGIISGALAIALTCGILVYRGRHVLQDLTNPVPAPALEIFSRWTELLPDGTFSWERALETLQALDYKAVTDNPKEPGQFRAAYPDLVVYGRPFHTSDQHVASQQARLIFSSRFLRRIESLPDRQDLASLRWEPLRLAQRSALPSAALTRLRIADLPPYVSQAVVAIEDKRFYRHGAIDYVGVLRALYTDVRKGRIAQGASTISQQLARSVFLTIDRTWRRKILEAGLAFYLEARYSKAQLLEMYLNRVYWGQDGSESLIGMEMASRSYFGKPATKLSVGESALLAGLLQSPNRYAPRAFPAIAVERRNLVLGLMKAQEFISADEAGRAQVEPLVLAPPPATRDPAPYFVSTLLEELGDRYSLPVLLSHGWKIYTTIDPVLQRYATQALKPSVGEGAMAVLDPRTGAVRAWVGGSNFRTSPFDRVVYAMRSPGSAFKPFVVLAALDSRQATAMTLLDDKPITLKTPQGPWSPRNYDQKNKGTATVWDSLVFSLNIPMVNLAIKTGLSKVADYARRAGIESPMRQVPSLALGTSETTVLELTSAYGTLANAGRHAAPYYVHSIVDAKGKVMEWNTPKVWEVVPPASAYLVTQMLQAVLEEGTGRGARAMGFTYEAAGKTGTSENFQDAWFVGYTPSLVCGVWVGYDQPKSLGHSAAGIALPLWVNFMQKALPLFPDDPFIKPEGLEWESMDMQSGGRARSGCPQRRQVAFLSGTAPKEFCTIHAGGLKGFFMRLGGHKDEKK